MSGGVLEALAREVTERDELLWLRHAVNASLGALGQVSWATRRVERRCRHSQFDVDLPSGP